MNLQNRTIFEGDNLHILRGIDPECIDLIYLDPPFNSNKTYEAPIGSEAAGAAFKDSWTLNDLDNAWHGELAESEPALYAAISAAQYTHGKSMKAYLIMMGIRMLEMRRILKPTGSIYLHCDPTASHYLKLMMDAVFGHKNFRNEIVWFYNNRLARKASNFSRLHDTLLVCGKTKNTKHNLVYDENWTPSNTQQRRLDRGFEVRKGDLIIYDEDKFQESGLDEGNFKHVYRSQASQPPIGDVWSIPILNPMAKERTGYPTQKPLALLDRIIKASSNKDDIVLDPFCGCATTCVAAERLQRQWIGIDLSVKAVELVRTRLEKEMGMFYDVTHRTDIPERTVPDPPEQIQPLSLFSLQDPISNTLTQIELRQYKTYKHTLFGIQEGKCNGCQVLFPFRNLTIDHIIPRSQHGTNHPDNLQLLCQACNSTKGTGTQAELIAKLKETGVIGYAV